MMSRCCPDWLAKILLLGAFMVAVGVAFASI